MIRALALALALAAAAPALAQSEAERAVSDARQRWAESPHGPMLERILPPTFAASELPDRNSAGARLVVQYCVQCHNLPNPAMHQAAKWPAIVKRMVARMQGKGNMGELMAEMMAGVRAPSDAESAVLLAYLERHAQAPFDPRKYPDIEAPQAQSFRLACSQCHVLPDPKRYTASQWRAVVARMEKNMAWMNRVVGSRPVRGEPQLRIDEINAYLAKHARRG
ncbi:MAG: hypothetical protein N2544_01785 [Burkholderiales bacterium]|nr:hypothetical protein [Burkholderiales bacterium]